MTHAGGLGTVCCMSEQGALNVTTTSMPLIGRIVSLANGVSPAGLQRIDAVVAVAVLLSLTTPVLLGGPPHGDPPAAILAFGAGAALPLAVRRRWPVAAVVAVVASTVMAEVLGISFTPMASNASPSIGLAMYTVAAAFDRRFSLTVLSVVVVVTFSAAWIATFAYPSEDANAVHTVAALAGWLVGDAVRTRRAYRADLADRQRREANERTRRAVAEERLQISREVHDVISHNLSVIAVRSGVGRMLFDTQPDQARAALLEVETVSRNALTELRRLLDAVRDRKPSRSPTPRLDDLPELVDQVAASGVQVTLETRGAPATLRSTLELSAYRIVQEALTNVVKHVGRTRARVVVEHSDDAIVVEVTDDGRADRVQQAATPGEGWGIVGMRERAALFGGTVDAGPRPEGGFRVSARLPVIQPSDSRGTR